MAASTSSAVIPVETESNIDAKIETLADQMRKLSIEAREKRSEVSTDENWKETKNTNDITLFFKTQVVEGAIQKIKARAGANNANILEYKFDEYFYVKDNKVIRVEGFDNHKPGMYLHKIYKVVKSDLFQRMLYDYVSTLGKMGYECWAPSKNLNVIEVFWGPTKRNRNWSDDDVCKPAYIEVKIPETPPPSPKLPESLESPKPSASTPASIPDSDDKSFKTVLTRRNKKQLSSPV